jgi:hypothetical protein
MKSFTAFPAAMNAQGACNGSGFAAALVAVTSAEID